MYVCLCAGVTDGEIKAALRDGAETVEEVMYCTGAGTGCGSCVATIRELVGEGGGGAKSCRRLQILRAESSAA
jgi:bacterioferritin-associated ferredoxin